MDSHIVLKRTISIVQHLAEAKVLTAERVLQVVFVQSPLNDLRCVILTGQLRESYLSKKKEKKKTHCITF